MRNTFRTYGKIAAVLVYLALTAMYTRSLRAVVHVPFRPVDLSVIPTDIAGYVGEDDQFSDDVLAVLGADETLYRAYKNRKGEKLWCFLGYFNAPKENSQIHSPKHCYPGSGWTIADESVVDIETPAKPLRARCLVITRGDSRRVVVYWFQMDQVAISNEYRLKLEQMKSALLGRSQRSTFVRLSTPVTDEVSMEDAKGELKRFARDLLPHLASALNAGDT